MAHYLMTAIFCAAVPVCAQQKLWHINAPAAGPFGSHLAVIGDRDGDGLDDLATTVYVLWSGTTRTPEVWVLSSRTGQAIGQGPRHINQLARAGDADGDGVADYVVSGNGQWLSACWPYQCIGIEVRSGVDDSLLWRSDMPRDSDMGTMLLGDLDLDGDGWPDVLVGSSVATPPGGGYGGLLYAFSRGGQLLYQVVSAPQEHFAPGLAKFIDYNGDGRDDFLLGMYEPTGRGAVDIRSGIDGTQLRRIYGVPPIVWGHGATAQMTGDLDGDGIPDVLSGDSGPGTPGVIQVLGSVTGNLIHRWQVNTIGGDDFGWPWVACVDVDRDGLTDVIANAARGPLQNQGQYIFSGRDGSLIQRYVDPTGIVAGSVVALPAQAGEMFPRFAARGSSTVAFTNQTYMFSGAPAGVVQTGAAGRGTLAAAPRLGVREFAPTGFRLTLSGAEPSAPCFLVVGFTQPALPFFDLPALGFVGCALFPQPDLYGFTVAGSSGVAAGYSAHDFPRTLVGAPVVGASVTIYAQWVTLGSGAAWPGGVSEAVRLQFL